MSAAVKARYPGDWEPIKTMEAEEALVITRKVRGSVRSLLPREALP